MVTELIFELEADKYVACIGQREKIEVQVGQV